MSTKLERAHYPALQRSLSRLVLVKALWSIVWMLSFLSLATGYLSRWLIGIAGRIVGLAVRVRGEPKGRHLRLVKGSVALILVCLFAGAGVHAQTVNVQAVARVDFTLPTTATDGTPLTGANALTKTQAFAATASISDASATTPTVELPPTSTTWNYTATVPNGSTLYFRLKACTAQACSALSSEASKLVRVVIPNVPAGVSVTVTVTVVVN